MTLRRPRTLPLAILGAIALTAAGLVGCTPEAAPTPTPTAAFASEEEAFAAAEEVYRAYISAFNEVDLQDPQSFEPVFGFTTGDYQSQERKLLSEMRAEGYIRDGAIKIIEFSPEDFEDDRISARACTDVSETTFTDAHGNSLVPDDRPDRSSVDLIFVVKDGVVLISDAETVEDDSCMAK